MSKVWSQSEVEAAVEDYFDMLCLELDGQAFNKTKHRRSLMARLDNRSHSAIELKHQNISAVLIEMGIPYIDGYKPLSNYQRSILPDAVHHHLVKNPELQKLFRADAKSAPVIPSVDDWLAAMDKPPQKPIDPVNTITGAIYNPTGVNYLEMEAQNQSLGNAGEEFVMNFERARLIQAGRESLVDHIERVSETQGPSAGFDIRSYEKSGHDRFIEVKTTKYGKNTPFFITGNELAFSQENASRYFLYRLFRFRKKPRMFALRGYLQGQCSLKPSLFIAKVS